MATDSLTIVRTRIGERIAEKNPRNTTEKMSFRKYDPVVRKHVDFKEAKIK